MSLNAALKAIFGLLRQTMQRLLFSLWTLDTLVSMKRFCGTCWKVRVGIVGTAVPATVSAGVRTNPGGPSSSHASGKTRPLHLPVQADLYLQVMVGTLLLSSKSSPKQGETPGFQH